jgi:putative hemolysin
MIIEITILIILLILSGFFSGLETAYTSLTYIQIRKLKRKYKKKANLVEELKENTHKLITTILICNNLVNIAASALTTYLTIQLFGAKLIGASTGALTFLVLIFGEVTPKKLAIDYNKFICLQTASFLRTLIFILTPIIWIIDGITYIIIAAFGRKEKKPKITEEDIINAVEIGEEIGELEPQERRMIHNIFKFNDIEVKDIMIHRTDVFTLEEKTKIKEILKIIKNNSYSRIPIYKKDKDNICGILLTKKVIPHLTKKSFKIKKLISKPLFVPETMKIDEMLNDFKKKKTHIAIVIDEKGGFSGIVTIEDVLEEIVGEIYDETDKVNKKIIQLNKKTYFLRGDTEITYVNKTLGLKLSKKDSFETISGYFLRRTGKAPKEKQEIKLKKGKFILTNVKNNRIESIKYIKK